MKRLLVLCAGLSSLLALASVQADMPPDASTAGVNHVSEAFEQQHSSFTVKDFGPDDGPQDVDRGNVSYHNFSTGVSYNADVVCVRVFGNEANFAFQIPPGNLFSGLFMIYGVEDVGEPGTSGDELGILGPTSEAVACSIVNGSSVVPNETITAGNIQVRQ